jgi:hypothetical protein
MRQRSPELTALTCFALLTPLAMASDAKSSATASSGRGRSGTAAASASYKGDHGFARTNTKSGAINLARGVAVGVDKNGLSLSVSTAVASRFGPAVATNFNMSIGRDGHSSASVGRAVATGGRNRSVSAGGATTTHRGGSSMSYATGRGAKVKAVTKSHHHKPRKRLLPLRRVVRRR